MSLFMCFLPLLWGADVISRFRLRFSGKDFFLAGYRALWVFFFLFIIVLLHQPKNISHISVAAAYRFYFCNFGFLPYLFLVLFVTAVFRIFLKRRYSFEDNFVSLMFVLFLTEVFRACYFQNHLNVYQALGQPFADAAMMSLLAFLPDGNFQAGGSETGKFLRITGAVFAASLIVPFFGVAAEYGFGWIAVAVSLVCFLMFRHRFLKKSPSRLYV